MRILLCIAVVLATAAGAAAAVARHHQPSRAGQLELLAKAGKTVTITGPAITGLYPGASQAFTVTVKNLNAFTIKVAAVKGSVAAKTTAAGCAGPANVNVKPSKPLTIAKRKSGRATLVVSMVASPANACQGARFTVNLSARAVKG